MPTPARLNTKAEVWKELSRVGIFYDVPAGASTTTDAAHSAGDAALSVTAETGFDVDATGIADTAWARIGSGEALEHRKVLASAAGSLTLDGPGLMRAYISGVAVVEQVKRNIGHVAEGGIQLDVAPEFFELNSATFAGNLVRRITTIPQDVTIPLLDISMANLALAAGRDEETAIEGAGSATDPYRVSWLTTLMGQLQNIGIFAEGIREDGTFLEMRFHSVNIDISKSMTFARNAATELAFAGRADGGVEWLEWS